MPEVFSIGGIMMGKKRKISKIGQARQNAQEARVLTCLFWQAIAHKKPAGAIEAIDRQLRDLIPRGIYREEGSTPEKCMFDLVRGTVPFDVADRIPAVLCYEAYPSGFRRVICKQFFNSEKGFLDVVERTGRRAKTKFELVRPLTKGEFARLKRSLGRLRECRTEAEFLKQAARLLAK